VFTIPSKLTQKLFFGFVDRKKKRLGYPLVVGFRISQHHQDRGQFGVFLLNLSSERMRTTHAVMHDHYGIHNVKPSLISCTNE
jgi:hypothetical protein